MGIHTGKPIGFRKWYSKNRDGKFWTRGKTSIILEIEKENLSTEKTNQSIYKNKLTINNCPEHTAGHSKYKTVDVENVVNLGAWLLIVQLRADLVAVEHGYIGKTSQVSILITCAGVRFLRIMRG